MRHLKSIPTPVNHSKLLPFEMQRASEGHMEDEEGEKREKRKREEKKEKIS